MVIAERFFGGTGFSVENKAGYQGRKENLGNSAHVDYPERKMADKEIGVVKTPIRCITSAPRLFSYRIRAKSRIAPVAQQ